MKRYKKISYGFWIILIIFHNSSFALTNLNFNKFICNESLQVETHFPPDSASIPKLSTKEIIYLAPKSGAVKFSWYVENYSNTEVLPWNSTTIISDTKLYTPMVGKNGLFKVSIKMPKNAKVYYGFWITKDKLGTYQDLWDWKHEEVLTFTDEKPIKLEANYNKPVTNNNSLLVENGWLIFLVLLACLTVIYLIISFCFKGFEPVSTIGKILILALSTYLMHIIARSEIIRLNPKYLLISPNNFVKLFKASYSDLLYIAIILVIFVGLFLLLNKKKLYKRLLYWIFIIFIIFSTIIAFTNITTVIYLGRPFNYEWFYYSDFLGSDYASTLIQENSNFSLVLNLILLGLSVLVLSKILQYVYIFITKYKLLKFVSVFGILLIIGVLFVKALKRDDFTNRGIIDNAIIAMTTSLISGDQNSSFFTLQLAEEDKLFIPNESEYLGHDENKYKANKIKNVLYLVLESAGAYYFDDYGGKFSITPNISNYAKEALIFKNVYAHAPATNKSMVSLLGSIYPYISYKSLTQEKPDFNNKSLPAILKNNGYHTSFFSSANFNWLRGLEFLSYRGFDIIEDYSTISCNQKFKQDAYDDGDAIDDLCLSKRFKKYLDQNKSNNFYSMIWTVQGHYPYFFSREEEDFGVNNIELNRYLNIIKYNDKLIGEILQILKNKNLYESTLVVVTGDHGEAFGQHNYYGHASSIHEENLRVPLYFINPEIFNGEIRSDIASIKDIASTTLSILDIDIPVEWQGRDLTLTRHNEAFFFAPWSDHLFGYRKDNMKFIFNETTKSIQVFDLETDHNERNNLFEKTSKTEIDNAKIRIASWVQYQDKFVKQKLLNKNEIEL